MSYNCLVSKAGQSSSEYPPSEASGRTRTLREIKSVESFIITTARAHDQLITADLLFNFTMHDCSLSRLNLIILSLWTIMANLCAVVYSPPIIA